MLAVIGPLQCKVAHAFIVSCLFVERASDGNASGHDALRQGSRNAGVRLRCGEAAAAAWYERRPSAGLRERASFLDQSGHLSTENKT